MYITNDIDSILVENLGRKNFLELTDAVSSDETKSRILYNILSRVGNSIIRCFESDVANNDVFDSIIKSKGDISKLSLLNEKDFDTTLDVLKKNGRNKEVSNIKLIEKSLISNKPKFMSSFKSDEWIGKSIYVGLVSTLIIYRTNLINEVVGISKRASLKLDQLIEPIITAIKKQSIERIFKNLKNITTEADYSDVLKSLGVGSIGMGISLAVGASSIGIAISIVTLTILLLLGLKLFVFWLFRTRIEVADYLYQNSLLLEIHKTEIMNNKNLDKEEKKTIIARQRKLAELLMKISEKIAVENITSKRLATNDDKMDTSETVNDAKNDTVDSYSTSDDGMVLV